MAQNVLMSMSALRATSTVPLKANAITPTDHTNADALTDILNPNLVSVKM